MVATKEEEAAAKKMMAEKMAAKQTEGKAGVSSPTAAATAILASGRKSPLATKNLLEDTDGLRRPP